MVLIGIYGLLQLPGLLAGRVIEQGHAAPPTEASLVRYDASEGEVGEATYVRDGDPRASARSEHDALWAEWTALVPAFWARRVEVFEIASDGTGSGSFAAYVQALDADGDRWLLAVDPQDAAERPEYYHETLVHELAHILTLGDGARRGGTGPFPSLTVAIQDCGGPATRHGCVASDSLLARFIERFWTPEDVAAADAIHAAGPAGLEGAALDRYEQRRSAFVTPYALTDPAEDIAETVTALAFGQGQPAGSIAEAKLDFLRDDHELVALVDRVRATLPTR